MSDFQVPVHLPQDLLLIHDLVGELEVPKPIVPNPRKLPTLVNDCIDSSDSENASEDEVEADLVQKIENDSNSLEPSPPNSDRESDSDSQHLDDTRKASPDAKQPEQGIHDDDGDDDDGASGPITAQSYFQTKNEVTLVEIPIPNIDTVGPEEQLEKVGEIMNIIDNVAIITGSGSEVGNRGLERVLDSETLLVFEDRKVMGYIYETFGPTSEPLYQVKFSPSHPLDPDKVRLSREVFHVPQRSRFVSLTQIKHLKGSDASNVHDEEPAEDELEFSDDEAEAAHKSRRRKRGESRAGSAISSRHGTPIPSHAYDQDMSDSSFSSANPYDKHGPYDMDFMPSPRPPVIPYDDPYSDAYYGGSTFELTQESTPLPKELVKTEHRTDQRSSSCIQEQNRRDYPRPERTRGVRGGRGRGRRDRGRRHNSDEKSPRGASWTDQLQDSRMAAEQFGSHTFQYPSIPPATGQYPDEPTRPPVSPVPDMSNNWSFQQHQYPTHPFVADPRWNQHQFIQPHINPRFASAFGLAVVNSTQSQAYVPADPSSYYAQETYNSLRPHSVDQWTVHAAELPRPDQTAEENGE